MTDPDSWWLDERAYAGREHADGQHARRYDAKMNSGAADEVRLLQKAGVLHPQCTVVDMGAGTGQFTLAAAEVCRRVVAVDVSPLMLARLLEKLDSSAVGNVEVVDAGFLTYQHTGDRADGVGSAAKGRSTTVDRAVWVNIVQLAGSAAGRSVCVSVEVRRLLLRSDSPQSAQRDRGQPVPDVKDDENSPVATMGIPHLVGGR